MTSGQGGNPPGGPYGPPEGWNAPPPPGPQYPGYAPAPSAPGGYGAPQPMERPTTVRAGLGAFIAALILSLVSSIVTFADFDNILNAALAAQGTTTADLGVDQDAFVRTVLVAGVAFSLVFAALEVLFIWFAWTGRNWARVVLWVLGGLGVVGGLIGVAAPQAGQPGFLVGLSVFGFVLTLAGIILLALKPSNEWYRFRKWQRLTGQR
jgi:hypothetical protein